MGGWKFKGRVNIQNSFDSDKFVQFLGFGICRSFLQFWPLLIFASVIKTAHVTISSQVALPPISFLPPTKCSSCLIYIVFSCLVPTLFSTSCCVEPITSVIITFSCSFSLHLVDQQPSSLYSFTPALITTSWPHQNVFPRNTRTFLLSIPKTSQMLLCPCPSLLKASTHAPKLLLISSTGKVVFLAQKGLHTKVVSFY